MPNPTSIRTSLEAHKMNALTARVQKECGDETCRQITVDVPCILGSWADVVEPAARLGRIGELGGSRGGLLASQGAALEEGEPGLVYVLFTTEERLATAHLTSLRRVSGGCSVVSGGMGKRKSRKDQ